MANQTSQSNFELEKFYFSRLNLGFKEPSSKDVAIVQWRCTFGAFIGAHNTDKHRYRVRFTAKGDELAADETVVGKTLDAEMVGFFAGSPNEPPQERDRRVLLNGISVLYGILRGVVATNTGCFPGEILVLPTITPQEIVASIKNKKLESENKEAEKPAPPKRERKSAMAST